jgi:hypothetical protein
VTDALPHSHFLKMCHLASLGFNVVPGAIGEIENGVFLAHCEYWFEPGVGVHLKRADGQEEFFPFEGMTPASVA